MCFRLVIVDVVPKRLSGLSLNGVVELREVLANERSVRPSSKAADDLLSVIDNVVDGHAMKVIKLESG